MVVVVILRLTHGLAHKRKLCWLRVRTGVNWLQQSSPLVTLAVSIAYTGTSIMSHAITLPVRDVRWKAKGGGSMEMMYQALIGPEGNQILILTTDGSWLPSESEELTDKISIACKDGYVDIQEMR